MQNNHKIETIDLIRELVSEGAQMVDGRPPRPGRYVSQKKAASIARLFGIAPRNIIG